MREWQVGDPAGDGNDIGVPDIEYMGYLNDSDDELSIVDSFKFCMNRARFNSGRNDEMAFSYLRSAFGKYQRMRSSEKSQIRDEPFNQHWIVDLCCRTLNAHGKEYWNAYEIIKTHRLKVKVCMDCDCMYPPDYAHCIRCGKPLRNPGDKSPEEIAREIPDLVKSRVHDKAKMQELVDRSITLMKSNGCRLVKILVVDFFETDFVFEKEHRYFKTSYICVYNSEYGGSLVFEEFGVEHNHDKLLEDESFQKLVKKTEDETGFTFMECDGGYGYQLDDDAYNFTFNDDIYVIARFDMGDGRTAVYEIDLVDMKFVGDYSVY